MDGENVTICLGGSNESKMICKSRKSSLKRWATSLRPKQLKVRRTKQQVSLERSSTFSSENVSEENGSNFLNYLPATELRKSTGDKLNSSDVLQSFKTDRVDCGSSAVVRHSVSTPVSVDLPSFRICSISGFDSLLAEDSLNCDANHKMHQSSVNLAEYPFRSRFSSEGIFDSKPKQATKIRSAVISKRWIGLRFRQSKSHDRTESLKLLLKDKARTREFRQFLEKEFNEENLDFWLEVESYKKCNKKQQRKFSQRIYDQYIESLSPKEVNIDAFTKKVTKEKMLCPDKTTFDLAQEKVYELMKRDPFRRFVARFQSGEMS